MNKSTSSLPGYAVFTSGLRLSREKREKRTCFVLAPMESKTKETMEQARWSFQQPHASGLGIYASFAKEPKLPPISDIQVEWAVRKIQAKYRWPLILLELALFLLLMALISYFGGRAASFLEHDFLPGLLPLILLGAVYGFHQLHKIHRETLAWREMFNKEETVEETIEQLRLQKDLPSEAVALLNENPAADSDKKEKGKKSVLFMLCILFLVLEGILLFIGLLRHRGGKLENASFDYVSLETLEGREMAEATVEKFDNTYRSDGSFFIPLKREIRQSGTPVEALPEGEDSTEGETSDMTEPPEEGSSDVTEKPVGFQTAAMRTMEYRCLSASLAHDMLIGRMRTQLSWNTMVGAEAVSDQDWLSKVDEAYRAGYQSMQYLFLRKGNRVMTVFYLGDINLVDQGGVFADYLNKE